METAPGTLARATANPGTPARANTDVGLAGSAGGPDRAAAVRARIDANIRDFGKLLPWTLVVDHPDEVDAAVAHLSAKGLKPVDVELRSKALAASPFYAPAASIPANPSPVALAADAGAQRADERDRPNHVPGLFPGEIPSTPERRQP